MTLLEQCQMWTERGEYQKIVDTIEDIPADERTPEMDSELARAYNNMADVDDRHLFEKALELLKPHAEYFKGDHCWNFRMAYAYYYLDREELALRYFKEALEARPGDEDTEKLIDECRNRLAWPHFRQCFRERVADAWAAFEQNEREFRTMLDSEDRDEYADELVARCGDILRMALPDVAFELGFNGEKYDLILSPEGKRTQLFPLVYFQEHIPASVQKNWNVLVGRQPSPNSVFHVGDYEISAEDVSVWVDMPNDKRVSLTLYCEKLLSLLAENGDRAWWMLSTLTDQTLGEVAAIDLIEGFNVIDKPKAEPSTTLAELPQILRDIDLNLNNDARELLDNSYLAYQLTPTKETDFDLRMDVYAGSSRLPIAINEYMRDESDMMDEYHAQGIVPGFFVYLLPEGENDRQAVLDYRDELARKIGDKVGSDAFLSIGGAVGTRYVYIDFMAWDLQAVLDAAAGIFMESGLPWGIFHSFRRDVFSVRLWNSKRDDEEEDDDPSVVPQINEETGSLLSPDDIRTLESYQEGVASYFYKMLNYLEKFIADGVAAKRFTKRQACEDLQIALWMAYACINVDQYEFYYRAAQWMPASEHNAAGCGTWYYRYSAALTYCGRLEEARRYAERGAEEEPDYPWIWLQVGKLRSHFGDKQGALEAVKTGLKLVPGDYEFLTLGREIEEGASIERMEYHWIDPGEDRKLQEGLAEDADEKACSISCITIDEEGLAAFKRLFEPDEARYVRNAPYCHFPRMVQGRQVDIIFQMNEAGLSKMRLDWLRTQRERIDDGRWLRASGPKGEAGTLDSVWMELNYNVSLLYRIEGKEGEYFRLEVDENGVVKKPEAESGEGEAAPSGDILHAEYYTADEMNAVERHIERHFGKFDNVFHELISPDIHVDICVVAPTPERDYYSLVTMGMGAHRMNVPGELAEYKLERAELAIALPSDWKVSPEAFEDEKNYWPVRLLKSLARLPIDADTWLGWGHTTDNQVPYAENTDLCAAMLVGSQMGEESGVCTLPNGEEVNFYQVIPLYRDEMEYKLETDSNELLAKMEDVSFVVDINRRSVMAD